MNLKELNEGYEKYILTEEYLMEGLKFFKDSKKLYDLSKDIDKRLVKLRKANDSLKLKGRDTTEHSEGIKCLELIHKDILKLADNYRDVEDGFASKRFEKSVAKKKLEGLQKDNKALFDLMKEEKTRKRLKALNVAFMLVYIPTLLLRIAPPEAVVSFVSAVGNSSNAVIQFLSTGIQKISGVSGKPEVRTIRIPRRNQSFI